MQIIQSQKEKFYRNLDENIVFIVYNNLIIHNK